MHTLLLPLALAFGAEPTADWKAAEAAHLKNITQVTQGFVRAGEGYFSPDGKFAIFQAEEKDTGNPFYQIFVQEIATGKFRRVSPGIGRTTCSFFRPDGKRIIFASSHETQTPRSIKPPRFSSGSTTARTEPRHGGTRGPSTRT